MELEIFDREILPLCVLTLEGKYLIVGLASKVGSLNKLIAHNHLLNEEKRSHYPASGMRQMKKLKTIRLFVSQRLGRIGKLVGRTWKVEAIEYAQFYLE